MPHSVHTWTIGRGSVVKLVLAAAVFLLLPAASASAGRLLVTGHDADYHCSGGSQCHFVEVATNYVRAGAPDPTKPVLVLDRPDFDFPSALDNAFGAGAIPRVVMEPQSAEFASAPLTTDLYSAILVASDESCGGCDLNPNDPAAADSQAINARKADIEAFFNAGGGVYVNSGAEHADGDPSEPDIFYEFLPIPATGVQVNSPFCLTDAGIALGFHDQDCPDATKHNGTQDDINCCATHNSFAEPEPGSPLIVSERDSEGFPETLFGEGKIFGGELDGTPPASSASIPSCSQSGAITVTVSDPSPGSGPGAARFRIDGGPAADAAATSGTATINVPEGSHSLEYWGVDQAGNEEAAHHTQAVLVDRTAPTLTIRSSRTTYRVGQRATARVTASDSGSGLATNPSARSARLSTRSTGRKRFRRTAVDKCGNRRTVTLNYRVIGAPRQVAGPSVAGTGFPGGCASSSFNARLTVRSSESLSSVRVYLDGRRLRTTRRSRFTVRIPAGGLRAGTHRVTITARDSAGGFTRRSFRFVRCSQVSPIFTG